MRLNLNPSPLILALLAALLVLAPLGRGLFFPPELLLANAAAGALFLLLALDAAARGTRGGLIWADAALVVLVLAYGASTLGAVHVRPAVGALLTYLTYGAVYWAAARLSAREGHARAVLAACYAGVVATALVGALAAAGLLPVPGAWDGRSLMSTLQYKNAFAAYLATGCVAGMGLATAARSGWRVALAGANALLVVLLFATQSRGGWMIFPVGLGLLWWWVPAAYRYRALFHAVLFVTAGLVAVRPFYGALTGGAGGRALVWLAAAAAAAGLAQLAYEGLAAWLNRPEVPDATRRLVARGGAAYMVAVTLAYTAYAAGTAPTVAATVLPAQVAARLATIGAEDVSFQARLLFAADAVRVALDRPWLGGGGGAWNALYHQYQSTVYWTTEVHNHLAQVWVEAGILGLAGFLGLVAGLVWAGRRALARLPRGAAALTATAGAAAATLFLHSVFDFDLSLAALGVALFGLAGVVRGTCAAHAPAARLPFGERLPWPRRPRARQVAAALLGLVLGAGLLVTAGRLYRAGVEGALGARALAAGDFARAASHYHLAVRLDPFTPEYRADLAQLWAVRAVARDDAVARYRALALAREAAARAPYDAVLRGTLRNVYMMLREHDLAVAEAMAVVTANPLVGAHWELLGQTLVAAALGALPQADGTGGPAGPETGNPGAARAWLERAAALPEELAVAEARLNREAVFGRRAVDRPPGLWLAAGQAHYLLGRYPEAVSLLERARAQKAPAGEVLVWLAAAHARRGEADRARALLEEAARAGAGARDRYREIVALGPVGG